MITVGDVNSKMQKEPKGRNYATAKSRVMKEMTLSLVVSQT